MELKAFSSERPKAFKTCEGFEITAEQAEPLETEMFPNARIKFSAFTPGKQMFEVLYSRF